MKIKLVLCNLFLCFILFNCNNSDSDLKVAMKMIAQTQKGPDEQIPSMGCNIKWFK